MTETTTVEDQIQEEPISARGWTKIVLTLFISIILSVIGYSELGALSQAAYDDQFAYIMTERGGNVLAANGEGQIAALMVPLIAISIVYGLTALVVQLLVNLVWTKKPAIPQIKRNMIHIK